MSSGYVCGLGRSVNDRLPVRFHVTTGATGGIPASAPHIKSHLSKCSQIATVAKPGQRHIYGCRHYMALDGVGTYRESQFIVTAIPPSSSPTSGIRTDVDVQWCRDSRATCKCAKSRLDSEVAIVQIAHQPTCMLQHTANIVVSAY